MPRLSKLLEKLEDTVEARWGVWFQRHKKMLPLYIPVGLVCWYFYGMLLNSMRLGIDAVFHNTGQDVTAIWIFDPQLAGDILRLWTESHHVLCADVLPCDQTRLPLVFRL